MDREVRRYHEHGLRDEYFLDGGALRHKERPLPQTAYGKILRIIQGGSKRR